jgi:hypothetical protein
LKGILPLTVRSEPSNIHDDITTETETWEYIYTHIYVYGENTLAAAVSINIANGISTATINTATIFELLPATHLHSWPAIFFIVYAFLYFYILGTTAGRVGFGFCSSFGVGVEPGPGIGSIYVWFLFGF